MLFESNFFEVFLKIIFGYAGSSLLCGLFCFCDQWGPLSSCSGRAFHCGGVSCGGAQALGAWATGVAPHGLSRCGSWILDTGSVVVARGLSCSAACGIFPDQGLNPCLLHWQVDSLPLSPQRSPESAF